MQAFSAASQRKGGATVLSQANYSLQIKIDYVLVTGSSMSMLIVKSFRLCTYNSIRRDFSSPNKAIENKKTTQQNIIHNSNAQSA